MEKKIKTYLKYAKELSFEDLVREGQRCFSDLEDSVALKSELDAQKAISAIVFSVYLTAKSDGVLSKNEVSFLSRTIDVSPSEVVEMAEGIPMTYDSGFTMGVALAESIKTSEEFDNIIKYCSLLSVADGNISQTEKLFMSSIEKVKQNLHL